MYNLFRAEELSKQASKLRSNVLGASEIRTDLFVKSKALHTRGPSWVLTPRDGVRTLFCEFCLLPRSTALQHLWRWERYVAVRYSAVPGNSNYGETGPQMSMQSEGSVPEDSGPNGYASMASSISFGGKSLQTRTTQSLSILGCYQEATRFGVQLDGSFQKSWARIQTQNSRVLISRTPRKWTPKF